MFYPPIFTKTEQCERERVDSMQQERLVRKWEQCEWGGGLSLSAKIPLRESFKFQSLFDTFLYLLLILILCSSGNLLSSLSHEITNFIIFIFRGIKNSVTLLKLYS